MTKDSKNWESPLEKALRQREGLERRIGGPLCSLKDFQEEISKPYRDIQTTMRKINQPYKDIQVALRENLGNAAMGQLGLAGSSRTQNLMTRSAALEKIGKQSSLQALAEFAKGPNIALSQWNRSFAADLSSRFSAGSSALQEAAESLGKSDVKLRRSVDSIINRSLTDSPSSAISSVIGLQPLAGQQALNMLNAVGSIGSVAPSIALANISLADLFPRFSAGSAFREVAESLRKSDVKLRRSVDRVLLLIEVIPKLANLGWFLARKILQDIPTDLLEIIRSTDPDIIARIIGGYFRKKLDVIANEIINNYPSERQDLLGKIFQAHRQREYCFSIPLSFIQADGISWLKLGESVFMKRGRENIIARYSLSFHEKFLLADNSLPIWASQSNRSNDSFILNRHQILHGESINYEDEINSLKTISFLYWIHCLA